MLKISVRALVFLSLFYACNGENPEVSNAKAVGERTEIQIDSATHSEVLEANAVPEGDIKAVAISALQPLQTAYKASAGKVPDLGDVTLKVDDNLNLILENKAGLGTTTTIVNLKSLDSDMSHIEVFAGKEGDKYPGFRIKTLSGKPKVAISQNGSNKQEQEYLEIVLNDRKDVINALNAITLAVQAAQQTLPAEGTKIAPEAAK